VELDMRRSVSGILTTQSSWDSRATPSSRLLGMALLQLLDNASKYASPRSTITLRAFVTDTELIFNVRNEGSFVSPEEKSRIFQHSIDPPALNIEHPELASASQY
jgi:K+-sensing histidine kinase KdpD